MAFTDLENAEHTATIKKLFWAHRRPPLRIRELMREGQRFDGQAIELFFVRPVFNDPSRQTEESIAKVQFVRSQGVWRIFWKRADLKWHSYPPCPKAKTLAAALRTIAEDANGCFFG